MLFNYGTYFTFLCYVCVSLLDFLNERTRKRNPRIFVCSEIKMLLIFISASKSKNLSSFPVCACLAAGATLYFSETYQGEKSSNSTHALKSLQRPCVVFPSALSAFFLFEILYCVITAAKLFHGQGVWTWAKKNMPAILN